MRYPHVRSHSFVRHREMNREIDDIVDETQLPSGRALAALTLLEVKGLVRRLPGRRFGLTGSIEQ